MRVWFLDSVSHAIGHPVRMCISDTNIVYQPERELNDLLGVDSTYQDKMRYDIPSDFWYTSEMMREDFKELARRMPMVMVVVRDVSTLTVYFDDEVAFSMVDEDGKFYLAVPWAQDFPYRKFV